jgi:hypothetical protein
MKLGSNYLRYMKSGTVHLLGSPSWGRDQVWKKSATEAQTETTCCSVSVKFCEAHKLSGFAVRPSKMPRLWLLMKSVALVKFSRKLWPFRGRWVIKYTSLLNGRNVSVNFFPNPLAFTAEHHCIEP